MIEPSHHSEMKYDPRVEKSFVKYGSLSSCDRGWYMIEPSHRSEIQESSIALREMKYDLCVERSFVKWGQFTLVR
jgi:hypothetical protein